MDNELKRQRCYDHLYTWHFDRHQEQLYNELDPAFLPLYHRVGAVLTNGAIDVPLDELCALAQEVRGAVATPSNCTHSADFHSVHWYGTDYTFTVMQAKCMRVLWAAWKNRTPGMSQAAILAEADSNSSNLRDIFAKGKHPAWRTMIVSPNKGTFSLGPPE